MRVEWRVGWDELSCGLAGAIGGGRVGPGRAMPD